MPSFGLIRVQIKVAPRTGVRGLKSFNFNIDNPFEVVAPRTGVRGLKFNGNLIIPMLCKVAPRTGVRGLKSLLPA